MAGLYSIIEGATGHRDALIWPSLGKSREAFTAMLVAANAYYLSLASALRRGRPPQYRDDREDHPRDVRPRRQRPAAHGADSGCEARTVALREGLAKLTEQLAIRTELLRNTIDASQAEAIGAIDELSVKMRQREQKAQETFDRTLSNISRRVLSIAVIFLGIILSAGVLIALSIRLPLQQILAAMHAITSGNYDRARAGHHRQGRGRRDGARGGRVPRKRHRQAQDRGRTARLEGKGRERAARAQHRAAEPDRRRTAGGARRVWSPASPMR